MNDQLQVYLFQLIENINGTLERIETSLARIEKLTCNPPFVVTSPTAADLTGLREQETEKQ
jgi:hypothetical protein